MSRPADLPSAPLARRYRPVEQLGRGGQGRVFAAIDELTGQRVAVKLVPAGDRDCVAQREIAVLRALRLPGVARLLDQGREGDLRYLVTELVEGRPFPGQPRPAPWSVVAGPARLLLRALGLVHRAGVVHGDLKPGNVLVTAEGKVRLLDFGLAHATSGIGRQAAWAPVGGTLHYLAPEVIDGQRPGPRADLFALGVLLVRSLTDRLPWPGDDVPTLVRARRRGPPRLTRDLGSDVPPAVEEGLARLLALDPEERPSSTREALALLGLDQGGPAVATPWSAEGPPLHPTDLTAIFRGPERVLHLPSDAASALYARTGGERTRVAEELKSWVEEGLAEVEGAYLRIDRGVVDHLLQDPGASAAPEGAGETGWQPLTRHLAGEGGSAEVVEAARALAGQALEEGRLAEAVATAELAFAVLRGAPAPASEVAPLLAQYAQAAVASASPPLLERAAWELRRLPPLPGREALAAAVDAMRLAILGHATEALELALSLPPLGEEPVAALIPTIQAQAARALPVEAEEFVLDQVEAWCRAQGTATAAARDALWRGHLRRRQGRLEEAAALFGQAAREHPDAATRVQARVEEARVWLAVGDLAQARQVARRALDAAARSRDATREATAWWLLREVGRREGTVAGPDVELVDAVHRLGEPLLAGRIALVEAAIAWERGFDDTAAALAMRARAGFDAAGHAPEAALAAALAAASGDAAALWWAREHFPAPADPDQASILLQAAALMASATGLPAWSAHAQELSTRVDPARPGEVLSPGRALELARPHAGAAI